VIDRSWCDQPLSGLISTLSPKSTWAMSIPPKRGKGMMRKLPFVGLLSAIVATSSAHAQSVSPDASVISPSTGGALRTADGTWSFGAALSQYPGNWTILLNGASAAGGGGSELEVANGGQMYALGAGLNWQLWQNSGWVLAASPASAPVSPDGALYRPVPVAAFRLR
jgi:hypothetical protein